MKRGSEMTLEQFKDLVNKFIKRCESDRLSNNTARGYFSTLNGLSEYIDESYEGEFDIKDVVFDYIDNLNSEYSNSTINTKRSGIRSFVSFLYERGYIQEDFSPSIRSVKTIREPREILEPDEIKEVLNYLINELNNAEGYDVYYKARNLLLFNFMLYTGTRRAEVVMIKLSDIDFFNDSIKIYGKGNKIRVIPLVPVLKQHLYEFRDLLEKMDSLGYNVKGEYLFRSEWKNKKTKEKDRPMTPRNVLKIIKDTCSKVGIEKNITAHSLRHTFASYGLQNQMNIKALADILGHSNPSTTVNIYSHVINMEMKKQEMDKIKY